MCDLLRHSISNTGPSPLEARDGTERGLLRHSKPNTGSSLPGARGGSRLGVFSQLSHLEQREYADRLRLAV